MHKFIGRKNELGSLDETFNSSRSEFRIIRGRRRVGKTLLLQQAVRGRNDVIFFSGLEDVNSDQKIRNSFAAALGEFSKDELLLSVRDLSWPKLFETVFNISKTHKKLILILDEIQWIARSGSGFLSYLKEAWTRKFQPTDKIKIIICGSSNKFFERKTGGVESVLYKLRTMSDIWVMPMTLSETSLFCKGWNKQEIALTQMMFGGIPYYLDLITEPKRGFAQCINDMAFTSKTIFFDEIRETLKLDLSSIDQSLQILSAIGQNGATLKKITESASVPKSTADELLEKLVEYQILFKEHPFGKEKKAKDFGVKYCIRDEFMNFFFSVLNKEADRIRNNLHSKMIFNNILKDGYYIPNFTGKAFELMVRKIIERNLPTKINEILSINNLENYTTATYWNKKEKEIVEQIDILVDSKEDRILRVIEIKWVNNKISMEQGNALEQVLRLCPPNPKNHKVRRFVVTSSGFTDSAKTFAHQNEIDIIDLHDLFDDI